VPDPKAPPAPDLVERNFAADRPNALWLADITYVPTNEGWLLLGVVMDMFSRKIVGWAMRDDLKADLVVDALAMAVTRRRPPAGLVHHSDRGSQYTSLSFGKTLRESGLVASMGVARGRVRQRRLRELHLDTEGGVDQATPVREPRPGAPLDLPVRRDVLQPASTSQLTGRHQPGRTRTPLSDQTTRRED
jgi:hypothetical protein